MNYKNDKNLNSYRLNNYRHSAIIIVIIFITIFTFWTGVSNAALDCSKCHTDVGKTIKARDTIEINDNTCLKCHNSNYPPTPIGYNTHLAHIGKYSVKVDYIERHPDTAQSLSCDDCHTKIIDCRNCHAKNIPHVKSPLGDNCKGCHRELDNLFRHPTINLKIHNLFNNSNNQVICTICHNPDNMVSLRLASGEITPIDEPHRLCYQCHSGYYNLWDNGSHYSNKTIPADINEKEFPGLKKNWDANWRKENTCTNCHNPHNPIELYQMPEKIIKTTGASNFYLYIVGIICIAIILLVMIKYKHILRRENILKYKDSLKYGLKYENILKRLKSLKLPKIHLPISISIEKPDNVEDIEKKETEIDTKPPKVIETKEAEATKEVVKEEVVKEEKTKDIIDDTNKIETKPKKNFWNKYRGDILFASCIIIMFSLFYIIFGTFMPIIVPISESMSPHMEKGDIMFYEDISRIDTIRTYNDNKNYISFEEYGDVILYKPDGTEDVTPIIHRAMYYVEDGQEMWPGGPKAPYAGYITKGDNTATNPKYDQQISTSYEKPVKKEWIIGVARYRIPYIGYIRLILP